MKIIKAAAVQISPVLYSREGTVEKVVRKIHELGQQGVQFATFPETVVPYYPYFSFIQSPHQIIAGREHLKLLDQAVTVPSPATNAISEACRQAGVVVSIGVNERDGGTLYNTQLLFDADGEQIHSAMYPGSIFGDLFAQQTEINIRQHALESACFVVNATAWLDADQQAQIMQDTGCAIGPISGGCFTAIVAPNGTLPGEPLRSGEGVVIADLDFTLIAKRKHV